jgi:hypothetical protein
VTTLVNVPAAPPQALPRVPHARLRGLPKRLVWLGATLLALEIFYVIAGNLFLRFGLLPIINQHPDDLLMGYERAYTLWPGVARVEHFHLRNQSRSIQWRLELDQADVTIDLLDLFGKTFSATRVRATGVAFRLRRRLDDAGAATPRAGALAPIEGFEDPPLKPIGPDEPPVSDADYDSWRIHLADVDAIAHEIWLEEHRLTGALRVRGGLYMIPDRLLHVGSTTLDIDGGELRIGDHVAMTPIDATIESTLGAIDLRGSRERAIREISGHVRLDARTPGLEFLRLYLDDPAALRIEDGSGSLHIDGSLLNGQVMPETVVTTQCDHLVLGAAKFAVTLDYHAEARVENGSPEPTSTGDLRIHRATLNREGAAGDPPRIEDARVHFPALPRDLAAEIDIPRSEIDAPAVIPDLRWLLPALTGNATLRARADVDSALRATGTVEASAPRIALETPSFQVSGKLTTTNRFHDADPRNKSLIIDPSVTVAEDVTVVRKGRSHAGGSLRVELTRGRIDDGVPRDFMLALAGKTPDLRWLTWHNPNGGDPLLTAHAANVNAKISIPYPASLLDGTPEQAAITGSVGLAGSGDVRFKSTTLVGDVEATAQLERLDLGRSLFQLRALRGVTRDLTTYHGLKPTPGWWSSFDVSRLDVDTSAAMRLDLRGEARCKDGGPISAILASEGVLPGWVGTIFPMKDTVASAELRRSNEKLDLGLRARGSSAEITVRLHDIGSDSMDGAVKVETKLVSIGVGFTEGQSQVKIFAGEEWLNARIAEANEALGQDQEQPAAPTPAVR